jgi:(E)-4-hydroxy-3-methyl-but-2-enyl pyrophosphate reductase
MTTMRSQYDVVICGAGAGGLTAAILFGLQGRRVLLVDKLARTIDTFKGELLQPGSLRTMDGFGALATLRASGAAKIERLVSATADGTELCFMDYRWLPGRYNHCLTHTYRGILENFMANLPATVEFRRGVNVVRALGIGDGRVNGVELRDNAVTEIIDASLVVAADGVASKLRAQAGIEINALPYGHHVVALDLTDMPSLAQQATTFLTPEGMRVMYPMPHGGGRLYLQVAKGIVNEIGKSALGGWMDQAIAACPALVPLTDSIHCALPTARVLSARRFLAPAFHRFGMPLLGDAAHVVHPMAGQGMNAAIADAAMLAQACADLDLSDAQAVTGALTVYAAKRQAEMRAVAEFSHRFQNMFANTMTRAGMARSRYILGRHGRNLRLCYKIMYNISGLGYQKFSILDRLQQLGLPDRSAGKLPLTSADPEVPQPSKRVLLARPRGYCAGVDRAVQMVERAIEHFGAPVYVRKQIVHNAHVVRTLEKQGAIFVAEINEVPQGAVVVFSAHGVAPEIYEQAAARSLRVVDATCPLVAKVHQEARRFAKKDYDILLIGHEGHEEVIGTSGVAPQHITLIDGPESVDDAKLRDPAKVVWLSQTTLSVDETMKTVEILRHRFPSLVSPPSDDICYATQNRQGAVKVIAPQVDLFLVVGSANSSNSVRMVETALAEDVRAAYLIENAGAIEEPWLEGVITIGLSAGASAPEILVQEVLEWLAGRGWSDVEEVTHVEEQITFALPGELRSPSHG